MTYAGLTAQRLGQRVGIVTSAGPDVNLQAALPGIAIVNRPAPVTTVFHNTYGGGRREQRLLSRAQPIGSEDILPAWRQARVVHLGPVAQELTPEIVELFPSSLIGVTAQGWLRGWDKEGRVFPTAWREAERVLPHVQVLFISEDDIGRDKRLIQAYLPLVQILVVTAGRSGAIVYYRGERRRLPTFVTREVDPTGAGDAFAAAYLIALTQGNDPFQAARFANCVASFVVEQKGPAGIPTLAQVRARLEEAKQMEGAPPKSSPSPKGTRGDQRGGRSPLPFESAEGGRPSL